MVFVVIFLPDWRQALAAAGNYIAPAPPSSFEKQRQTLINLFYQTNGANWLRKDNWLGESGTECSWYGVECYEGYIRRLNLSANNLTGSLPHSFGFLPELRWLDLSRNAISGYLPQSLDDLENLSDLDLSQNNFTGPIPAQIASMSGLRRLHLHSNRLQGAVPSALGMLSGLTDLTLGNNQLTGQLPTSLGSLSKLQILDLSNNLLVGDIPVSLTGLTGLVSLNLSGNQLSGGAPAGLSALPALFSYNVSNNPFVSISRASQAERDALMAIFQALNGEQWLQKSGWGGAAGTECNWYGVRCVNGTLDALLLDQNNLNGHLPSELFELTRLTEIRMQKNAITGSVPLGIDQMNRLLTLDLRGTSVDFAYRVPPAVRATLIDLYNSTDGSQWFNRDNWLGASGTECSWYGVACVWGSVRGIYLANNNLTGALPVGLSNLETITGLDLKNNNLTGNIPTAVISGRNLLFYDLSGNPLLQDS